MRQLNTIPGAEPSCGKLNVAFLYDDRSTGIATVREHMEAFRKYSRHHVYYVPGSNSGSPLLDDGGIGRHVDLSIFDVVIVHYAVRLALPNHLEANLAKQLAKFSGLKILFIQDEYDTTETARRWMEKLRFDLIYTCVPPAGRELVYPKKRFPETEFLSTLTGYVPEDPRIEQFITPLDKRTIRLGYRGRKLSYVYGKLGQEKYQIGVEVKRLAQERGIPVDIEVTDNKRIYGTDWYKFVGSVRATLGSESGANVFDFDGSLTAAVNDELKRNPKASFDEIHARYLAPHEGLVQMNQISPRVFEAIRLRTALVLFEGAYSNVLTPELHYLPLKKDYSNIDAIFARLEDLDYLKELTDRAYRDIILPGTYSYRSFVEGIDRDIAARVSEPARYELFATPVAARKTDGTLKVLPLSSGYSFTLSSGILSTDWQREHISDKVQPGWVRKGGVLHRSVRYGYKLAREQRRTPVYYVLRFTYLNIPQRWREVIANRFLRSV